jgi:uncharacterized caspase-like protein
VRLTCWGSAARANLYVLTVGVSEYKNLEKGLWLRYADKDASELADVLRAQRDRLFGKVVCKTLVNQEATRDNIRKALRALAEEAVASDGPTLLIVSFSGHGERDRLTGGFNFIPYDYVKDDPDSAVPNGDVTRILKPVGDKYPVVVFVDACHSDRFQVEGAKAGPEGREDVERAIQQLGKTRGVVSISACDAEQQTRELAELRHGVLTYAILKAIRKGGEKGADSVLNLMDLYDDVKRTMKELQGDKVFPPPDRSGDVKMHFIPIAVREAAP